MTNDMSRYFRLIVIVGSIASFVYLVLWQIKWVNSFSLLTDDRSSFSSVSEGSADDFVQQVKDLDGMTESLNRLLYAAVSPRMYNRDWQDDKRARCERYGYKFSDSAQPRRIFWGSLIADDWWHVLAIAAMEYRGLFHTISFVESNTTQSEYSRQMRFPEGSLRKELLTSPLLWGNTTQVHVDYFYSSSSNATFYEDKQLWREADQRNEILKRWKMNGMTKHDIGFISDVDEVATRDFLLALQTCDVPEFFPSPSDTLPADRPHDCITAKVMASTIVFEGSPLCYQVPRRWYHPDFLIGECLEGIGDPRPNVPRKMKYTVNLRVNDWKDHIAQVPFQNTTIPLGPLWDAADVRMLGGSYRQAVGTTSHGHANSLYTAYHFHNFFESLEVFRRKYLTYGHPQWEAMNVSLGDIHKDDVGFMVDCLTGRSDSGSIFQQPSPTDWSLLDPVWGTPIAFQHVPEYRQLRHEELQRELAKDVLLHPPPQRRKQ